MKWLGKIVVVSLAILFVGTVLASASVVGGKPTQPRWSVTLGTAPGIAQDVWVSGMGNNIDGWKGGGSICLSHLAQGFPDKGLAAMLKSYVFQAGVVGVDATPMPPGTYLAPSAELGDRVFDVVAGETFYVWVYSDVIKSKVPFFQKGDQVQLLFTFDMVMGNTNQLVVLWFPGPGGWVPFLNEGVMMTHLRLN